MYYGIVTVFCINELTFRKANSATSAFYGNFLSKFQKAAMDTRLVMSHREIIERPVTEVILSAVAGCCMPATFLEISSPRMISREPYGSSSND